MDRQDEPQRRMPHPGDESAADHELTGDDRQGSADVDDPGVRVLGGTAVGSGLAGTAVAAVSTETPRNKREHETAPDSLEERDREGGQQIPAEVDTARPRTGPA
jgi:hypothetical protein